MFEFGLTVVDAVVFVVTPVVEDIPPPFGPHQVLGLTDPADDPDDDVGGTHVDGTASLYLDGVHVDDEDDPGFDEEEDPEVEPENGPVVDPHDGCWGFVDADWGLLGATPDQFCGCALVVVPVLGVFEPEVGVANQGLELGGG